MTKAIYIETTAVVAWLLDESLAAQVISAIDDHPNVVTSALTLIECERALIRAESKGRISAAFRQHARRELALRSAYWVILEITPHIRERASGVFPVEPIRSLDAIHLATALEFLLAFDRVDVLSFDQRILDNLRGLGFFDLGAAL